ncbi:hypothetical protein [Clostridium saccharobutylicum]|uniref:Phage protein n=1 Tax=Clostridium saccharobutylicum DSM 13864 TaxID=1345695 RepID=U5MWZ8_CLOSA|nr:hypothetical protein [Clostridium saccharobutylicum]AGX43957.1 hypothetical protein CLSA_c29900 [Clostridium saccharobutylicum DSM 13864]AQR91254.1 hypothetical protein CLOSC_29780 [Clostridium saccharobutylicum]AQS01158.1 hypothetical protein CSACC_29850 [Clostridium saccharobutylicum]AQS10571.1 hypothetical protein CLOBY_27160 [Clostridium saccharobutylicum]AQS15141.1 hypothetical protein CLOSACC_29850 [Clostridium saccharobutylicum]
MGWFYNKEIFIYKYSETDDEDGVAREGYTKVITTNPILVDVQPYSSEKAKKDYGYDIETTKRIFCDIIPEIIESAVIKYREQFYSIQKIVEWDDYLDVMLFETEVDINE